MNAAGAGSLARVRTFLELVRFSHTVFALPFAVMALFLASEGGRPDLRTTAIVLVCMVSARTAAMAYNRLVDHPIDARNPRTSGRHLPRGVVSRGEVLALTAVSAAVFVGAAFLLNPLAFRLSLPVLVVLLGYSHTKRFTFLSHFVLGVALGLSPLGVWVAVRGAPIDGSYWIPAALGAAVLAWVAGFDILYACQDEEFDRREGLFSIPARFGVGRALRIARASHVAALSFLLAVKPLAGLGGLYLAGVVVCGALLAYEHRLVREDDLSRLDLAFFTVNGCVSLLLCGFTIAEVLA